MLYRPYRPRRIIQVDALYSLHYFNFRHGYFFPGERHDFWELVYADMGGASLEEDVYKRQLIYPAFSEASIWRL